MVSLTISDERGPDARPLSDEEAANRQLVLDMFEAQIHTHDFDTMRRFYVDDYVDHNHGVPGGDLEGLAEYVTNNLKSAPDMVVDVKRILVDGMFVTIHLSGQLEPGAPVDDVLETFRIEGGRIAEHWETIQRIDEGSPNPVAGF